MVHQERMTFYKALHGGAEAVCLAPSKSEYRPESRALQELIDILNQVVHKDCLSCCGTGLIHPVGKCSTCHGTGKMQDDIIQGI